MRRILLPTLILPFLFIFSYCSRKETAFKNYEPIKWKDSKVRTLARSNDKINYQPEISETSLPNISESQFVTEGHVSKVDPVNVENKALFIKDDIEVLDRKENKTKVKLERAERKSLKRQLKEKLKSNDSDVNVLLLVLIAILIPPVAVGIVRGWTSGAFFLNILLTLLFYLPGLIHALVVIFSSEE